MFVLLAGPGAVTGYETLARMAGALLGTAGAPRLWRAAERAAAAASLEPAFLPEDVHDAQPLVSGERVFLCQARVDNRGELLGQLGLAPDLPIADSGLLAAAYDRWGEACVERIAGDYAFAARHRDGRVVAAVDPLGVRRLCWARAGGGLILSPQLRALLAHEAVSAEPDLPALAQMLDSGVDRTATPFRDIRSLPGGHTLVWRGGDPHIRRWWSPAHEASIRYRDPRDYVEEARELFSSAVAAMVRSSGPISSTLSGGLDSGAVTAAAAGLLAREDLRLTAYTSVPEPGLAASRRPNWEADDSAYACEVAGGLGNVDHRLVRPGGRSTIDVAEAMARTSSHPAKSATNLLWLDRIASEMKEAGSRVLLTGQRGNGAFSWRGQNTVGELARISGPGAALRQARLEAAARGKSLAWVLAASLRDGLGAVSRRPYALDLDNPGLAFIRPRYRPAPGERGNEYALAPGTRAFWAAFATTPQNIFWPDPVAQWGVEFRDPTGDRRLLERLLLYPQAAFRASGRPRGLARSLTKGLLPDRVRLRSTQGAQVPEAPALIAAHIGRYRLALRTMRRCDPCRELLDLDSVAACLERFGGGLQNYHLALRLDRAFGVGLFLAGLEGGDGD
ncbi:MAG TPA: asparagine synthase-related protein [Allosphingosinicella sp.]|jgi:asparagine synthase (glutamine-hydrolysing)